MESGRFRAHFRQLDRTNTKSMKYHCLILSLALSLSAFAASPTGFADIPFGVSLQDARTALASREGLKSGEASAERLTFTGGSFSGQPVSLWTLAFAGGKFAAGSVLIDNVKKPVYDDIKAQLAKKYGKPDSEKGHHSFECLWEFRSDGRRTIRLDYEYKGKVTITYSNDSLAKAAPPAKKTDL